MVFVLLGVLLVACTTGGPLALPTGDQTTRATIPPSEPVATTTFLPLVISTTTDVPADLSGLSIYMEKTGCEGPCPVYAVTIQGDGRVIYNGKTCVNVVGEQTSQLSPEAVRSLVAAFYANDFFALADSYVEDIQDLPATLIRFTLPERSKQVVVQLYDLGQTPAPFQRVEEAIYNIANLQPWVTQNGTPAPCP
jgi:hypothetical protein